MWIRVEGILNDGIDVADLLCVRENAGCSTELMCGCEGVKYT